MSLLQLYCLITPLAWRVTNHPHVGSADPNPRALHTYQPPRQVSSVSSLQKGNKPISKYLVLIWINILPGILMIYARVGEVGLGERERDTGQILIWAC